MNATLNLTPAEIDLLLQCIKAWEEEPAKAVLSDSLVEGMFARGESRKESIRASMEKSTQETLKRERVTILLKARIVTYQNDLLASVSPVSTP